jgi:hypothetical protein
MENQYVVKLNDSFILITDDYNEAEEFYNKQVQNWKDNYKDKVIENNDKLVLIDYSNMATLKQFSKLDLL